MNFNVVDQMASIYENIKELCNNRNITVARLERELSFSEGSMSKWKNSKPSFDKVLLVADYFNISLDYLTGRSKICHTAEHLLNDSNLIEIQIALERMNDEDKERMMNILRLTFTGTFKSI